MSKETEVREVVKWIIDKHSATVVPRPLLIEDSDQAIKQKMEVFEDE